MLPWYAILGIAVGVPAVVFVMAMYCLKFGYKWRTIYMDAKKTGQQELTIGVSKGVDKESDISIRAVLTPLFVGIRIGVGITVF